MARKEVSRTVIFESMPVYRAILTLAIPNVVNQLANVVYNLADTIYIGRLNNSSMVAALTITAPIVMILTAFSNIFCVGGCALIASAIGAKNKKKAEDLAMLAPLMAGTFGIIMMLVTLAFSRQLAIYSGASETSLPYALQYQFWVITLNAVPALCSCTLGAVLRGRGYSKYEMYGITLGNVLNIILDPIFIFVFDMGVVGAASATFISSTASFIFFLFICRKMQKKEHLFTPIKELQLSISDIWQVISTGFPAFLHTMLTSLINTTQMNLIKGYTDAAVASLGIVRKIEHTFGQIIMGVSQGVIPLVSYNYAAKNYQRLSETVKKTVIMCCIWGVISFLIIFPFAEQFMRIFINDPATIAYGIPLVKMYAVFPIVLNFNANFRSFMQCMGYKKESMLFVIMRQLVFFLPLLLILNHFFGFYGACSAMIVGDIATDIVGYLIIRRVMRHAKEHCSS